MLNWAEGDMSIVLSEELLATVALRFSLRALHRLIPWNSCSTQLFRRTWFCLYDRVSCCQHDSRSHKHDYEYKAKVCAAISYLTDETPMRHRDRWIRGFLSEAEDTAKFVLFHIAREGQHIVVLS